MSQVRNIPLALYPPGATNGIRAALQVLGQSQWNPMAANGDFLLGRGASLIVAGGDTVTIGPGTNRDYRFWTWPHVQNTNQLWLISLSTIDSQGANGTFTVPGGSSKWSLDSGLPLYQSRSFQVRGIINPADGTSREAILNIANDTAYGSGYITVHGICCYELPRVTLDSFAIAVADIQSCEAKRPIFGESANEKSVNAVCRDASAASADTRRACLFSWFRPNGIVITAGSFPGTSNIFVQDPSIVNRHLHFGENSRNVEVAVRAKVNGGSPAGDVKVTAATGASLTLNYTSTSATWKSGLLAVETEDLTRLATDGGLRGGSRETLRFEARNTGGTSIQVYGICVGEP